MLYIFLKRFLPILIIGIGIYILIFLTYTTGLLITSFIIEQKSHDIRSNSLNDMEYVENTKQWVYKNIKYSTTNTMLIQSPEITFLTKQGDCSEYSLLIVRMLTDEGIDAYPIYGSDGIYMHESVEYILNGDAYQIDKKEHPNFKKYSNGIPQTEFVVNPYWFLYSNYK